MLTVCLIRGGAVPLMLSPCSLRGQERYERNDYKMKNARLNLRITAEDLEKIHHKAQRANKTLTDYVTATCLGKEIVIITDLAEVLKELKAVGRNLNQLATLANMGRVQAVNLTEILECFIKINQSLQEILERRRWSA